MNLRKHYQDVKQIVEDITTHGIDGLKVNNFATLGGMPIHSDTTNIGSRNYGLHVGGYVDSDVNVISEDYGAFYMASVTVETDGVGEGRVYVNVSSDGTVNTIKTQGRVRASEHTGTAFAYTSQVCVYVPPGGGVLPINNNDPANGNGIEAERVVIMSP